MGERRQPVLPYARSQWATGSVLGMRSSVSRTMCWLLRLVKRHSICKRVVNGLGADLVRGSDDGALERRPQVVARLPAVRCRIADRLRLRTTGGGTGRFRRGSTEQSSCYGRELCLGSTAN